MSGFQFPPPPPPPPPSASQAPADRSSSSNGGSQGQGRGRGSGRRRGGPSPRGRGHGQYSSHGHGNPPGQQPRPLHSTQHQTTRGGLGASHSAPSRAHGFPSLIPAGSHVNPNFRQGTEVRSRDTFQSSNASSLHRKEISNSAGPYKSFPAYLGPQDDGQAPSRSIAGHKRKLDALRGPRLATESAAGPPSAPVVPAFGTSLGASRPTSFQLKPNQSPFVGKLWRSSNALGLTPQDAEGVYSSSDSGEEEDGGLEEETFLAATLGPGLTFHDSNGEMRSLNTAADLLDWRKERARKFPTKTRLAEKEAEKRMIGAERNRLLNEAREVLHSAVLQPGDEKRKPLRNRSKRNDETSSSGGLDPPEREATVPSSGETISEYAGPTSHVTRNAQAAATNVPESVKATKEGGEQQQGKTTDGGNAPLSSAPLEPDDREAKQLTTGSLSDPDLDIALPDEPGPALDISSDSDGPEESTSKAPPPAVTKKQVCKFYSVSGYCRDGSACRFRHELTEGVKQAQKQRSEQRRKDPFAPVLDQPSTDAKKSIHQRMIEQEEDREDQLALQVIKYLGRMRFFA